jgi:peptide/nickel transport system permease protein
LAHNRALDPAAAAIDASNAPYSIKRLTGWRGLWGQLLHNRLGFLGLLLIGLFALMASLHPLLMATIWNKAIYNPLTGFDSAMVPHPTLPSFRHLLGTDAMGRDVLSQLLFAAQVSFGLGLVSGIVATTLATILGVVAAHFGGWLDAIIMGVSDAFVLMPAPVILLVIGLLVDMGWLTLGLVFGVFTGIGAMAMIAKSYAQSIRVKPYIDAARVAGGNDWHILRVHYLPNMVSVMLANMMFTVTQSVLVEALLSFFGRTQLRMSWGTMIWLTQSTFRLSPYGEQWHALLAPVVAIMLFCGAFYLVGRSLDEVVNPRLQKR